MRELDKVLDPKEQVFWEGGPSFWPFVLQLTVFALFGIPFMVAGGWVLLMGLLSGNLLFFVMPHFWVGFGFVFGIPLYRILVHQHTYYAVTDKRVLIQTGLIGRDFKIVEYDQVTNAEVNVGIADKLFGNDTGSILISTPGTFAYGKHGARPAPYSLSNITHPYEVFKFFKKVSHDVKTDIQYPNKLRPLENPGFGTAYHPTKSR